MRFFAFLFFCAFLFAEIPTKCYRAYSESIDLVTMTETTLKRDNFLGEIYFRQYGDEVFASSDRIDWTPLYKLAENNDLIQFGEVVSSGHIALYAYHKGVKKLTIQKSYKLGNSSLLITAIFDKCVE